MNLKLKVCKVLPQGLGLTIEDLDTRRECDVVMASRTVGTPFMGQASNVEQTLHDVLAAVNAMMGVTS